MESVAAVVAEILIGKSMFKFDAKQVAETICRAELLGLSEDGFGLLVRLLDQVDRGEIDPRGRPVVLDEAPAMLFLDGSSAAGPVAVAAATKWLAQKTPEVGAGVVVVKSSREAGNPALSSSALAEAGLVGICSTSCLRGLSAVEAGTRVGAAFPVAEGTVERFESTDESTFAVIISAIAGGHAPVMKEQATNSSVAEHVLVSIDPGRTANLSRVAEQLHGFPSSTRLPVLSENDATFPADRLEFLKKLATSLDVAVSW